MYFKDIWLVLFTLLSVSSTIAMLKQVLDNIKDLFNSAYQMNNSFDKLKRQIKRKKKNAVANKKQRR